MLLHLFWEMNLLEKLDVIIDNEKGVLVEKGTIIYDFLNKYNKLKSKIPVLLVKFNKRYYELTSSIEEAGVMNIVSLNDSVGFRTYVRTLQFILIKAVFDIYPEARVTIEHSISKALFGEIHMDSPLCQADIIKIKKRMTEIINKNIKINKVFMTKGEAENIFRSCNMQDKINILKYVNSEIVYLYELDGVYDFFYGYIAYSTGAMYLFDIMLHDSGFILRYPVGPNLDTLPDFAGNKKLDKIFKETEEWAKILDVAHVGSLNNKVLNGEITDIIRISEAFHEKKIANIADMISERRDVKLVLIAGPSSSGKTTFSKRLGVQMRVNGLIPVPISLDNYFLDRKHTPTDENGNFDFEALGALDLKLFNENLEGLLLGKEINIPDFNFITGERVWNGHKLKLPDNGVILVEGIHGLNDTLTQLIPAINKFKIYISALTQLNIDDHSRIATTDVRIIRRIVRDHLFRGYSGEDTLKMWSSIRRGEEKNIFVYQENADAMFNSTLVYELCVLKKCVFEVLDEIDMESPVYPEAFRLKCYLNFIKEVPLDLVPDNSILREFLGGSSFYKY